MSMLAPTLQAFFSERLIRRTEPIQFGWAVEHPKIIFLVDGHATRLALELTQKRAREHRLSHPRSKREKHKDRHRQQRAQTAQQGAKRREAGGARVRVWLLCAVGIMNVPFSWVAALRFGV